MSRRSAIVVLLAIACVDDTAPTTERDVSTVSSLLDAIDVHRTVALATEPERVLELDDGCRTDPIELPADLADTLAPADGAMRWEGPCFLEDGALLDGSLTLTPTPDGTVLSAEAFTISEGDDLQVSLSGALELSRVDDLLQLDVSMQACGAMGNSCGADPGHTVGLDLDYSVYPMDTFPSSYSVSVSGAVDGDGTFVSVEGAWQADDSQCGVEPTEGSVAFGTFPRQTLTLEGTCDGCVDWQVEGIDVAPLCAASAW